MNAAFVEFVEVLRQRLDLLVAVVGTLARVAGEGVTEREEEVVPVAAGLDGVGADAHFRVRVATADARRIVSMRENV